MLRNTRVQMAAILAIGALLGYLVASGRLNPFQGAEAAPPATADTPAAPAQSGPGCCEGACKGEVLALAGGLNPRQKDDKEPPKDGKKPNILFIMGDDIGIWNIGAYHRGIMSGKTPNLDKLASQGMLFTDYYAEAS